MSQADARLRLGMVGGGQGGFIGAIHRAAARLCGRFDLVAGAFSSRAGLAGDNARLAQIAPARSYDDFRIMAEAEAARDDGVQCVAIVAPNNVHFAAAAAFLERGVHVFCEKPLALNVAEAGALAKIVQNSRAAFALAHTYSGYAMVRRARALIEAGELGALRSIQVEYAQDWLATPLEGAGNKQAGWRTDPAQTGLGGAIGDIGTHAFHLAEFVSGGRCVELAADLSSFVPQRRVDDDARILLRFKDGARGMLWCSQVAVGCANGLNLRVFGESGALTWRQETPNTLTFTKLGQRAQIVERNGEGVNALPGGHPEGYVGAFAQLYSDFAARIRGDAALLLPGIEDGVRGMHFVAAAVASSRENAKWIALT